MGSLELPIWCAPRRWFPNLLFPRIHLCLFSSRRCSPLGCYGPTKWMESPWTPKTAIRSDTWHIFIYIFYFRIFCTIVTRINSGGWTRGCHVIPLLCVGYLLLEWLCFITVRSEIIARIKNDRIFIFIFIFILFNQNIFSIFW